MAALVEMSAFRVGRAFEWVSAVRVCMPVPCARSDATSGVTACIRARVGHDPRGGADQNISKTPRGFSLSRCRPPIRARRESLASVSPAEIDGRHCGFSLAGEWKSESEFPGCTVARTRKTGQSHAALASRVRDPG